MSAQGTSAERGEAKSRYQRILLKLSGEVMAGEGSFGLDAARVKALTEEVAEVAKAGVQIGLQAELAVFVGQIVGGQIIAVGSESSTFQFLGGQKAGRVGQHAQIAYNGVGIA